MSMMFRSAREVGRSPSSLSNCNSNSTANSMKLSASSNLDSMSNANPPHDSEAMFLSDFKSIAINNNCNSNSNSNNSSSSTNIAVNIDFISEICAAKSMPIRIQSPHNNPTQESSTASQAASRQRSHWNERTRVTSVCLSCNNAFVCEFKPDTIFCSLDCDTSYNWLRKRSTHGTSSTHHRDAKTSFNDDILILSKNVDIANDEIIAAKNKSKLKAARVLGEPITKLFTEKK